MLVLGHPIALALTMIAVLIAMSSAAAQTGQPPRSAVDIQAKILKSAELQQQALQSLDDLGRAQRLISNASTELEAALSAIIIKNSGAKFQDPLLAIQRKRAEQALTLLQEARDALSAYRPDQPARDQGDGQSAAPRSSLDGVHSNLERALNLTRTLAF